MPVSSWVSAHHGGLSRSCQRIERLGDLQPLGQCRDLAEKICGGWGRPSATSVCSLLACSEEGMSSRRGRGRNYPRGETQRSSVVTVSTTSRGRVGPGPEVQAASVPMRKCTAWAERVCPRSWCSGSTRTAVKKSAVEQGRRSGGRSRSVEGVPATDQWRITRAGADLDKGFQTVIATAVQTEKGRHDRREGSLHQIARCGCRSPGGYRSPIRLAGGSRLLTSDPRDVQPMVGCGYFKPIARSVDGDVNPNPGAPGALSATGAPCDVEVR